MGLYQALGEAARNAPDCVPPGFKKAGRNVWILYLEKDGSPASGPNPVKDDDFSHVVPKSPSDRTSGRVSPALFVDKASYALGLSDSAADRVKSDKENKSYQALLADCLKESEAGRCEPSQDTLFSLRAVRSFQGKYLTLFRSNLPSQMKSSHLIVFMVGSWPYVFSDSRIVSWISSYHSARLTTTLSKVCCVACGTSVTAPRLSPKVSLFKQQVPISAFNLKSSNSAGKVQMLNAPVCDSCASLAEAALGHLLALDTELDAKGDRRNLRSGPHTVTLAEDVKKGGGGRPLANQRAIFWTKDNVSVRPGADDHLPIERIVALTLEDDGDEELTPEARPGQVRRFLESPWYCAGREVNEFDTTAFYFAVLSPNKTRLAIREWIETDVARVRETLLSYRNALAVISPEHSQLVMPALRQVLEALRAPTSKQNPRDEKPRLADIEPELTRQIIRTMFQGAKPPAALLARAVQAYRMPDAADGEAGLRLSRRRTALIAAMKLILTYDNPTDMKAMTELTTPDDPKCQYKRQAPYLCGKVLALLNSIQQRASSSGGGVNTTVVDKFYAAASTAPQTVLGSLLKSASTAHLPKMRKEGGKDFVTLKNGETVRLSDLLSDAVGALDEACGPLRQHTPKQQAEFALGFHHQQAALRYPPKSKSA